ncbi:UDP-3-O-(3-hydroxymyristoyl)glucosamine N-acyltransferase [Congregibacter litoralis]|uniref:UDP-3-O-acylglucosamine N-acyltransferase n=1 Tax=Congregibacter litoralis KT71 TaxID=314285 RepID=A4ACZ3_9GAMM|nr:UDP-3-O-(3-hydroxymyristoyl)glucosamine N-acyltransferase [Congregibacter litoralis]EAQ96184.1 UDP-3-O-[3-hydroxymyristoyl] glucosamine N-acyltransferase [Congregibacter litoralis KT71]
MVILGDLVAQLACEPGAVDVSIELDSIAPLGRAGPRDLAFVSEARYLEALKSCRAGCVILKAEWQDDCPVPSLCVPDPYLAYARVSRLFETLPRPEAGVHAGAFVDASATVPASASVAAGACVEAGAVLGESVVLGHGVYVGHGARLGNNCRLWPGAVLYHDVELGDDCVVHANTIIGADGFGFARRDEGWEKISQLGSVRIGNRVDIGAGVTIDRGALDDTVIADDVIIDDQVHIAHNCVIGRRTAIAGCVGMAGSTEVGEDCTFAGQVGVSGHLKICDNAHFAGQSRVSGKIDEPGSYTSGTALEPTRQWRKNAVRFTQLDGLQRRLVKMEARLKALDEAAGDDV